MKGPLSHEAIAIESWLSYEAITMKGSSSYESFVQVLQV